MNRDNSSFQLELGRHLAGLRERAGLTQEALGQQIGRDQPYVSKIERGTLGIQLDTLLTWLHALSLSLRDVADDIEALPGAHETTTSIWSRERDA